MSWGVKPISSIISSRYENSDKSIFTSSCFNSKQRPMEPSSILLKRRRFWGWTTYIQTKHTTFISSPPQIYVFKRKLYTIIALEIFPVPCIAQIILGITVKFCWRSFLFSSFLKKMYLPKEIQLASSLPWENFEKCFASFYRIKKNKTEQRNKFMWSMVGFPTENKGI